MYKLFRIGILILYVLVISVLGNVFGAVLFDTAPYSYTNGVIILLLYEFIRFVATPMADYALYPLYKALNIMFGIKMED